MREVLRWLSPLTLELTFVLMVGAGFLCRRMIRESLGEKLRLPALVFVLALVAVKILPPETHRIFYDEDIYQNVAQNILWLSRAQMCNEGILEAGSFRCEAWEYNKEPNGWPFLLSLVFRVCGVRESAAHELTHWVFAFGTLCVYWLSILLFERNRVAVGAAVVYALTPTNLLWSATVAAEPAAASFAALGLGALVLFVKNPSMATGLFAASSLAFACQFRPESVLVLAVAGVGVFLFVARPWKSKELRLAALVGLFLVAPHLAHLGAVGDEDWGSEGVKFSTDFVLGNLKSNLGYFVEGSEFPRYFTLLAVVGLAVHGRRRETWMVALWFLLFFGVFIPFYAGSYRYGADVRFSLPSAAPIAILAGLGIAFLAERLARLAPNARGVGLAPVALALYAFSSFVPFTRAIGSEAWASRADHETALEFVGELPEESILLTHNPGMIQVLGQTAAQASMATYQPERVDALFRRYSGGVYFHYSFWCNVPDTVQNQFCSNILETFGTRVVREKSARFYRYVLYRLLPRTRPP